MKCFCEIDYNLLTSIIALIVAVGSLIVAIGSLYLAVRYQKISLLNAQLADKARECNGNLDSQNLSTPPRSNDKVSGFLSSIITAEELLNYQVYTKKGKIRFSLWGLNVQSLIDQFYLQLHTTIRVNVQKNGIEATDLENENHLKEFKAQFNRVKDFLSLSIEKNSKKEFEGLKRHTAKRKKNQ